MRAVASGEIMAMLADRARVDPRVRLVMRSNLTPEGASQRMETWLAGDSVWLVFVHGHEAYVYEHLDDPAGVLARLAPANAITRERSNAIHENREATEVKA